jgi:hypothetical protein
MVKTPPMIPESIPNSIPPKQACLCQRAFVLPCRGIGTHRACQGVHAPSVDLWGILLDSIVVDDLVKEAHIVGMQLLSSSGLEARVCQVVMSWYQGCAPAVLLSSLYIEGGARARIATRAVIRGTMDLVRLGRLGSPSPGEVPDGMERHPQELCLTEDFAKRELL